MSDPQGYPHRVREGGGGDALVLERIQPAKNRVMTPTLQMKKALGRNHRTTPPTQHPNQNPNPSGNHPARAGGPTTARTTPNPSSSGLRPGSTPLRRAPTETHTPSWPPSEPPPRVGQFPRRTTISLNLNDHLRQSTRHSTSPGFTSLQQPCHTSLPPALP